MFTHSSSKTKYHSEKLIKCPADITVRKSPMPGRGSGLTVGLDRRLPVPQFLSMRKLAQHNDRGLQGRQIREGLREWGSLTSSEKPRTTCRRFRLVSPSRLAVSMWHSPSGSLDDSSRMSAGMISLQRRWTKSPTRISFQYRFTYFFSSLVRGLTWISTLGQIRPH